MHKTKNLFSSVFLGLMMTFGFSGVAVAATQVQNSICAGGELSLVEGDKTKCSETTQGSATSVENLIGDIVNILSIIVGVVAVIMIIYGGFRYVTSSGDSANISTAKNIIIYAIIGLIVAALAQIIVKFVLANVVK